MDVYTFGYLMTTQKSNTPYKKTDFYKRLDKKNRINKRLNESIRRIIHCSKGFNRNRLKHVHDDILHKVRHYLAEWHIWSDSLEDKLEEFTTRFSNGDDLYADLNHYCLNEATWGCSIPIGEEIKQELKSLFDPYFKRHRILENMVDNRKLQHEVNSLLHYFNWRLQNAFDMIVASVIAISNNIKSKLKDEGDFSYFNLLKVSSMLSAIYCDYL